MRSDFAVFICTHGRPYTQHTLNTLRRCGYTGKCYLLLDDTDKTIQQYIDEFGPDDIIVFDKEHYINTTDVGTNNPPFKCILYAKNAIEDIAEYMGLKYFVIADDDIQVFRFRYLCDNSLKSQKLYNMDSVIDEYLKFLELSDFTSIGFGSTQAFFGGSKNLHEYSSLYKLCLPYNFVFRNAKYKVNWKLALWEDTVTPLFYSKRGYNFTQIPFVQQAIVELKKADGGMKETYNTISEFEQNFYAVMYAPDVVCMDVHKGHFYSRIKRTNSKPHIISSKYRRTDNE